MGLNFNDDKNLLLSKINQEEVISLAKKLIRISSVTGNENEIGNFLYDYLKKYDFSVSKDYVENSRPNILARYKKGEKGKTILLNGHVDTVPAGDNWSNDPFSATEDDCYIHGLGSADMKGGLAAQICAMKAFMESGISFDGEIIFSGVVGEEYDQIGTRHLVNKKDILADYSIVSEPTNLHVVSTCKGDMDISIHIKGKAAHASVPEKGLNAIYLASKIVLELEKYSNDLKKTVNHQILGNPTLVVGTIKGGKVPTMVAGSCDLRVDRRLLPNEDIDRATSEVKKIVDNISIKYANFTTETKLVYAIHAMECDIKSPLVVYLQKNIDKLYGGDSSIYGWPATCDGNILSSAGVKTVVFGPGTIDVAHQPDERIEKNQLTLASKIIAATIFDLFKLTD